MTATIARPTIMTFDAGAGGDPDGIAAALIADGAAIVRGLIAAPIVTAFNAEIEPHLAADDPAARRYSNATISAFYGGRTRHVSGLAGKSAVFRDALLVHPLLMALCDRVLGPHCAAYQLNFADVMDRAPGSDVQMMHRDDGVWPYLPPLGFPLEFAMMIALGDFTPAMGATRVVPGSHRWPAGRAALPEEMVTVELEPGDAALYLGSVLHGAGANRTDRRRRGMHLSYCLGWLRTQDNQCLIAPPDLVRTLSREQQALLGYAIHDAIAVNGGYLGAVDWRDPRDLMAEGKL